MNTSMLAALALAAWAFFKGKPAVAAPAAPPPPPRTKPSGVVTVPEVVIRAAHPPAAVPLSVSQPVSAKSVPWPAVEQEILDRPATQSTARYRDEGGRTATLNVAKHTGSNPQNETAAVIVRERNPFDSSYWMSAKKITPADADRAKAILAINWQKGGITYDGPRTFAGRRQFRAVEQGGRKAVTIWQPKPPFGNETTAPRVSSTPGSSAPTLRQGSQGNDVAYLQKLLNLPQDGKFGPNTKAAVVTFQKSKALAPDGIVGRQTWAALGAFQ